MKSGLSLWFFILVMFVLSCNNGQQQGLSQQPVPIWNHPSPSLLSKEDVESEMAQKMLILQHWFSDNNLDGMLFTQVRNFYWITAGRMNNQIVLNKDIGAASALIMKDGRKYLICSGSESKRMMDEGMRELGFKLLEYNWFEANSMSDVRGALLAQVSGGGELGSDIPFPGTVMMAEQFRPLRYSLLAEELKRYRWLCVEATEAVEEVCRMITPGMNEFEIEAITSTALRSRGLLPTVLLTAVDQRIYDYRHALPGGAVLKQYAMINIVAEKWGMPVAVTRFVHFGELPLELEEKFEKTAIVNALFQQATVAGKRMNDIFEGCKTWYAAAGYEGEWEKHHQGGAIGYDDREYVIFPGNQNVVQVNQAFAWNPTITGAKIENTILAGKDGFEVLTQTGNWPLIIVDLGGKKYPQPGVLIRHLKTGDVIEKPDIEIKAL